MSTVEEDLPETLSRWEIPSDWRWVSIADVGKVITGNTPPTKDESNYGNYIPFVKPPALMDGGIRSTPEGLSEPGSQLSRILPAGAVLVSCIGGLGKTGIAKVPVAFNQQINAIVFDERVIPKFGFYYAQTLKSWLYGVASATTLPIVNKGKFQRAPFPVAPLDQQKHIVAEIEKQFSRLDEAVANLKRVKANLKRYKAAVLKAAVEGRLVETEAELARREGRSYETGEQLLQRILETRRRQWQRKGKYKEPAAPDTTDLPELPEGWVWATLEQLCPTFFDSAHRTPIYGDTGAPAIGPRDVVGGDLRLDSARLVDDNEFAIQTNRHIPQPGDIVYSRELSLGWGAVVPGGVTLCLSQGMCLFRPHDKVLLAYFIYSLNGPEIRKQATRGSTGSAHPHLNLGDIKAFVFSLPPQSEQQRIVAELDHRISLVREVEVQVDANFMRAERLRQSILSRAFSGQLSSNKIGAERQIMRVAS